MSGGLPWNEWLGDLGEFCGGDRRQGLSSRLSRIKRPIQVWKQGDKTHFYVPYAKGVGDPLIFLAHYDAVPGSPGANDNGASVFHLLDFLKREPANLRPLHLLFTDGEELTSGQGYQDQGVFSLGPRFEKAGLTQGLFVVLDMTGKGDTLVLGRGGEEVLKDQRGTIDPSLWLRVKKNRLAGLRALSALDSRGILELPTPFSDDLGLLALGIPALQISLLPRKEALLWKKNPNSRPEAWKSMHTPEDLPQSLERESWVLMRRLLDHIALSPML